MSRSKAKRRVLANPTVSRQSKAALECGHCPNCMMQAGRELGKVAPALREVDLALMLAAKP